VPDPAASTSPESPAAAVCRAALVQLLEAIKPFVAEKEAEGLLYGDPEDSHA
jgi:hypothetical protein